MFDTDTFIARCIDANRDSQPRLAIKELLAEAVAEPSSVAAALPPDRSGIFPLHRTADLTILHVVWAPHMHFVPHEHRMWAAIGMYTGGEDNFFYRRASDTLTESGGKELRPRDVVLLGDDTIHAVTNPTAEFAGAIHIYGGDLFGATRSEWRGDPYREQPYDVEDALRYFDEFNINPN